MKKIVILSLFVFGCSSAMKGQIINKPEKEAEEKSANRAIPFHRLITAQQWRSARIWYPPNLATVDSVLSVVFNVNGTVTWNKHGWEHVPRTAGTYTVTGNKITIDFNYFPYTHHLVGTYSPRTGKSTGAFYEEKAPDPAAPPAYAPGTIGGEFNFYKK
jgi:hypothetical protein